MTTAVDSTTPSTTRQAEFAAAYQANVAAGRPPYWHVHIHTLGELDWIMTQRGWSGNVDELNQIQRATQDEYIVVADLRDANFSGAQLVNAKLIGADLSRAFFLGADLTGAQLVDSNLSYARLRMANLNGANLQNATMTLVHGRRATFAGANLTFASLQGARLSQTDLRGARLVGAHLDAATILSEAQFDERTQLADVIWNGALLTRIAWDNVKRLGDEDFNLTRGTKRGVVVEGIRNAARAYNGLAGALKEQGLAIPASRFRLRAQVLERRALRKDRQYVNWLGSAILDAVAGYGERAGRAFVAYVSMVLGFAAAYFFVGQAAGPALSPLGAFIFSITSFHGRGFFPGTLTALDGPFPAVAAAEAVVGLFIELVFIATFSRRFLGN
ncbi:MAG: pentapeptide repeat-containing protein [Ktedonobacterales bacterium]|nr:pentapeptide repeat-containing protein [Ktedonobacterales bacterium]